jgi:hypothetical protein
MEECHCYSDPCCRIDVTVNNKKKEVAIELAASFFVVIIEPYEGNLFISSLPVVF